MYISKYDFDKLYNKGFKKLFKFFYWFRVLNNNRKYIDAMEKKYGFLLNNINGYALDKEQKEVVLCEEDSALVVAGAGSGKSLTILGRILYLISLGVLPQDILVLSFTNEACNSLKSSLKFNNIDMDVLTFHKLGRRILKNNGYSVNLISDDFLINIIDDVIKKCDSSLLFDFNVKFGGDKEDFLKRELYQYSDAIFSLKKLLFTFINLFKSNGYKIDKFNEFLNLDNNSNLYERNKAFLLLAKEVYLRYEKELETRKLIDFHDMIGKSVDVVLKKGIYNYKYIIIDEYQDTSLVKCKLIKAIKEYTGALVLAVGDDWQSIYRFTGSNLKIFTDFSKYFKYSKIFKLKNTYRNSLDLIRITSRFILKNPKQIYKKLSSSKVCDHPIYVYYYDYSCVSLVNNLVDKLEGDVLVLGRNNADLKGIKARSMTVHRSKGLEADNVIIVNLEDSVIGFPNKIINDDVLKYVMEDEEQYAFAEERRLFYVALTRTKNVNYLFVKRSSPSLFVQELMKYGEVVIKN